MGEEEIPKKSKFWAFLKKWGTRLGVIAGIIVSTGVIYKYTEEKVKQYFTQPFEDLAMLRSQHAVYMGIIMDQMLRQDHQKVFYTVLQDGVKRRVYIFATYEETTYAFLEDDRFEYLPYRCFYDKSLDYWYLFEFDDDPFTIIYEE
jgi:hypothetical protein